MSLFLSLIRLFRKESFPGFPLQKQSCSHSIACISKIQSDFSTVFRPFCRYWDFFSQNIRGNPQQFPSHISTLLQACSWCSCSYFSFVASPPRICRSALLTSRTARTDLPAPDQCAPHGRWCLYARLDFEIPNFFRRFSHCCIGVYHKFRNLNRPFLNIRFHYTIVWGFPIVKRIRPGYALKIRTKKTGHFCKMPLFFSIL